MDERKPCVWTDQERAGARERATERRMWEKRESVRQSRLSDDALTQAMSGIVPAKEAA